MPDPLPEQLPDGSPDPLPGGSLVLLGDVEPALVAELAAGGLSVRGSLALDPFGPPAGGRRYAGLDAVLADDGVRAAVLPAASPLAQALPDLLARGLPVLLADAAPWDADLLRAARAAAGEADVAAAVALQARHTGWAALVAGALSGRRSPQQVTVRGWPRGPAAAAELVDLLRGWCGDVVAAAAAPAVLPADALPDGPRVAWALLTDRGTTVLVAHEGQVAQVRLSLPPTRLLAGPDAVGWEGATTIAPAGREDPTVSAFAQAAAAGSAEPLELFPTVARPADLVPVARVLAALRASARSEAWVELG